MHTCKHALTQLLVAGSIALALQFSAPVQAAPDAGRDGQRMPPPDHGGMREQDDNPPFLRGIELSEEQQDKIFSIMHKQEPLMREQSRAARKAHDALRALASSGQYDDAKAKALAEAGARAMADMALQHARSEQLIHALLTPEQRKQAEAIRSRPEPQRMREEGISRSVDRQPRLAPKPSLM